ncbi:hypothetical protein EDB19DRAFT_1739365 [Suillus lakei]|nr:hypothetical protein EDB19DRAFT_1739365 [Suillus lakei]
MVLLHSVVVPYFLLLPLSFFFGDISLIYVDPAAHSMGCIHWLQYVHALLTLHSALVDCCDFLERTRCRACFHSCARAVAVAVGVRVISLIESPLPCHTTT